MPRNTDFSTPGASHARGVIDEPQTGFTPNRRRQQCRVGMKSLPTLPVSTRRMEAIYAEGWYRSITADIFG